MREIKFRAWDPVNKKMYYWDSTDHPFVDEIGGTPYPKLFYLPMSYLVGDSNEMVWMQFTGLHDKNGKEIYEGDILLHKYFGQKKRAKGVVLYQSFSFVCKPSVNSKRWYEWSSVVGHEADSWEIIGNIYENPEL